MTRQMGFACVVTFVLGCGTAGLFLSPTLVAQQPAMPGAPQPRYAAVVGTGTNAVIVIVDEVTGECWTHATTGQGAWNRLGSPAAAPRGPARPMPPGL